MRVADKMSFNQVNSNLHKNRGEVFDLQNKAATQKRVVKPSDDPIAATRVLKQRTEIHGIEQFLKNITSAKNFLEFSEQSLGDLTDTLIRAKELALGQASDAGASAETRRVVATEIEQLFHHVVGIGNRKLGDRFLFGGFSTVKPPFSPEGEYQGDHGQMMVPIDKENKMAINLPGSSIFLGLELRRDGQTGGPASSDPLEEFEYNNSQELVVTRGPASEVPTQEFEETNSPWLHKGVNIFKVLKELQIALETNDKVGVQESLEDLDSAISQAVLLRSRLGARVNTLDKTFEAIHRSEVDAKAVKSQAEDVDAFELVTDINRAENTLKTSLHTSGQLLQTSLLDFLR
jgi:flagellar hook-associated protein 3 FlgL